MNVQLEREVRARASDACEYCLIPQSADIVPHQIDHIIAAKHGGRTVSENLALACLTCNASKGPNIAGLDPETQRLTRLYSPREDHWHDHFVLEQNGRITTRTAIGRVTLYVLNITEQISIVFREMLILEGILKLDR